jgi:hypothetical protein
MVALVRTNLFVKSAIFVVAAAITSVWFINFCAAVFGCGCHSLWAGAAQHCNVHNDLPPHCPWCVQGGVYGLGAYIAMVLAQAAVVFWPGGLSLTIRALAAVLAFPVVGAFMAVLAGWYTGYWA